MSCRPRPNPTWLALGATILALLGTVAAPTLTSAAAPSIGQLSSELGQQQTHQQSLSASLAGLARVIGSLDGQIALVQSRETAVRGQLASDRRALASVQGSLAREQRLLTELQARLVHARRLLSRQLRSNYEVARPDVISVVLEAHGFADLLDRIKFLHDAERQQQGIIGLTRVVKAQAAGAARRLASLEATDRQLAQGALLRDRALQGMNGLLKAKQAALQQARSAQQAALRASRSRAGRLRTAISQAQARQAAAARAAAQRAAAAAQQAAASAGAGSPSGSSAGSSAGASAGSAVGPALGPSGGWAIPYAIVLCESGGQNLPPNGAGASGYYQIIPGTWVQYGGSGPAAYLTGKAEQDAVASRIWNGGAGASNWVCAGLVGIH